MPNFTQGGIELLVKNFGKFQSDLKSADKSQQAFGKSSKDLEKQSDKTSRSLEDMGASFAVIGASGAAATAVFVSLALDAAKAQGVMDGFNNTADRVGLSLGALQQAAKGTISDFELMQNANVALTGAGDELGQAFGKNLPQLLEIARASARATGQDVGFLFQSLVTGVKRTSPLLIDNTGLQLKMGAANEALATQLGKTVDQLSGEEKQIAILNATLAAGEKIISDYGSEQLTAAEEVARFRAEVDNAKTAVGTALLPALTSTTGAIGDIVSKFKELPQPMQNVVAQTSAMGAGVLGVVGAIGFAIPKITSMVAALGALGPAILGPAGVVAGLAALVIVLKEVEKAGIAESAQLAETTGSYEEYIARARDAGIEGFALSRSLYEVATAAHAAGEGFTAMELTEANREVQKFLGVTSTGIKIIDDWILSINEGQFSTELYADQLERMVPAMTDAELAILSSSDAIIDYGKELGLTGFQLRTFESMTLDAAKAEQNARDVREAMIRTTEGMTSVGAAYIDTLRDTTRETIDFNSILRTVIPSAVRYVDVLLALGPAMKSAADATHAARAAMEKLGSAMSTAMSQYEGVFGAISDGILTLRDLDDEAATSTQNYEQALIDLERQASQSYGEIGRKFKESLPDATTVAERKEMLVDAWDEWALRLQDIMNQGVASPWAEVLMQMGFEKPPDVGIKEWAADLKQQFEAGELQELINKNTEAWKEHAQGVKQAQAEETAAVSQGIAQRRAELEKARQEELAAQQTAREKATMQLALQIAEESGQLQAWADQRLGAYAGVADTADEVFGQLEAGTLQLDDALGAIITENMTGLQAALDMTGQQAEENKNQMSSLFAESQTLAQGLQQDIQNLDTFIQETEGIKGMLPPEDAALIQANIDTISTRIGDLGTTLSDDQPFADLTSNFTGAMDEISGGLDDAKEAALDASKDITKSFDDSASEILDVWLGNSVIPDMIDGFAEMSAAANVSMADLASASNNVASSFDVLLSKQGKIVSGFTRINKKVKELIDNLAKLQSAFDSLTPPDWLPSESPPPMAVWFDYITESVIGTSQAIGVNLAKAFMRADSSAKAVLETARSLTSIGSFFSSEYEKRTLDPLEEQLEAVNEQLDMLGEDTEQSSANMMGTIALLGERAALEEQIAFHREKQLAFEQAQADLKFLEQQFKLLELVREQGLDTGILRGIEFGLGADVDTIVTATTAALQAMAAMVNQSIMTNNVNVPIDATINNGMDAAAFQYMVEQAVTRAINNMPAV